MVSGALPSAISNSGEITITRKLQLFVLPQASLATAVTTFVVSRWNTVPEGGVDMTVTELQRSVASTVQLTGTLVVHVTTTMFDGHVIAGGTVLTTVTVWVQTSELLQQSIASQAREISWPQPVPLVSVESGIINRFVQQGLEGVGGSNVQALPHCTLLFVVQLMAGGVIVTGAPRIVPEKSVTPPVAFS